MFRMIFLQKERELLTSGQWQLSVRLRLPSSCWPSTGLAFCSSFAAAASTGASAWAGSYLCKSGLLGFSRFSYPRAPLVSVPVTPGWAEEAGASGYVSGRLFDLGCSVIVLLIVSVDGGKLDVTLCWELTEFFFEIVNLIEVSSNRITEGIQTRN